MSAPAAPPPSPATSPVITPITSPVVLSGLESLTRTFVSYDYDAVLNVMRHCMTDVREAREANKKVFLWACVDAETKQVLHGQVYPENELQTVANGALYDDKLFRRYVEYAKPKLMLPVYVEVGESGAFTSGLLSIEESKLKTMEPLTNEDYKNHPHWGKGCYCRAGAGLPPMAEVTFLTFMLDPRGPIVPSSSETQYIEPLAESLIFLEQQTSTEPREARKVVEIKARLNAMARAVNDYLVPKERVDALMRHISQQEWAEAHAIHVIIVKENWRGNEDWLLACTTFLLMLKKYHSQRV